MGTAASCCVVSGLERVVYCTMVYRGPPLLYKVKLDTRRGSYLKGQCILFYYSYYLGTPNRSIAPASSWVRSSALSSANSVERGAKSFFQVLHLSIFWPLSHLSSQLLL